MKINRKLSLFLLTPVLALSLTACGSTSTQNSSASNAGNGSKGKIEVGGKDFTEQRILPEITAIYLKANGYDANVDGNMGSSVVRSALENGQIDMYWEYTGTSLVVYNKQPVESNPDVAYQKVKELDAKKNLVWLNKSGLNDTYAILMQADEAKKLGIQSLSDLAKYVNAHQGSFKFATDAEFSARKDGLPGLEKKYGFQFAPQNVIRMDAGLVYNALKSGQVDAAMGLSTDGRIKGFNLVVLKDNQMFFPAYNAAPVVRKQVLDKYPDLTKLLNNLSDHMNNDAITEMNYEVDVKHEDVAKVARDWLVSEHLIKQ